MAGGGGNGTEETARWADLCKGRVGGSFFCVCSPAPDSGLGKQFWAYCRLCCAETPSGSWGEESRNMETDLQSR